jgi:hypothetical protein
MTNRSFFTSKRRIGYLCIRVLVPVAMLLTISGFGLGSQLLHAQEEHHAGRFSYSFTKLETLSDPAKLFPPPSGPAFHINDFEPGAINNRDDVIYGTDLGTSADPAKWSTTFFGEGVFVRSSHEEGDEDAHSARDQHRIRQHRELDLGHSKGNAPGGGIFDVLLQGQTALNDEGDGAFVFTLSPLGAPVMVGDFTLGFLNSGVYRYSHTSGKVTPVVIPNVTHSPAGGTFPGVGFNASLNNRGDLVFAGFVGDRLGIFKADKKENITSVVSPGDPMPGHTTFESGAGPWINQRGDVAFTATLTSDPVGRSSIYVKQASTGKIISIAHGGDPAPRGGIFRGAFSPVLNDLGDLVFEGDLSPGNPSAVFQDLGVYLYSKGTTIAIARPGDSMPGGGHFVTASFIVAFQVHVNNEREVGFSALLDTDDNHDGSLDTGLYVWSHGALHVVARTGTVIPDVGTIRHLATFVTGFPPPPVNNPNSGAVNNDRGQVFFCATLTDGRGVLLIATPKGRGEED